MVPNELEPCPATSTTPQQNKGAVNHTARERREPEPTRVALTRTERDCLNGFCFHDEGDEEHARTVEAARAVQERAAEAETPVPSIGRAASSPKRSPRSDPPSAPAQVLLRHQEVERRFQVQGRGAPVVERSESAPELLTTSRLAQRLSRNPRTILRWLRRGCPYAVKLPNGSFLFALEDVLTWLGTDTTRTVVDPRHREVIKAAIRAEWSRLELERRRRRRGG